MDSPVSSAPELPGMVCLQSLRSLFPATVRGLIRQNRIHIRNTSGMSAGYNQANVVILNKSLANDFEKFCQANSGPLPLLYRSDSGQWKCPPLSSDSDIRTDCLLYRKYEHGIYTESLASLESYSDQLKDMVTFYLGCSFSFESAVQKLGVPVRNVDQQRNVSMYTTTVPCHEVGKFSCNLVVTMRPVPQEKLEAAVIATHPMKKSHGAPVHIGSPDFLGINDLQKTDYGEAVQMHPGDIPVFWACGVTGVEAVVSCKSPLAFTHSPGCMFITDVKNEDASDLCAKEAPKVVQISSDPLHYSLVSQRTAEKIRSLEEIVGIDPGNRGIKNLLIKDELLKCCLSLSHAKSILITTGFPTHYQQVPPEETDGPPGALAMAAMLQALGKKVAIVTDGHAIDMNKKIVQDAVEQGVLKMTVPVLSYKGETPECAMKFLCENGDPAAPRFDHLVAIERAGRASDGNYYNARKINIKHLVDPIDDLFVAAQTVPGISTTGVGDGGNELGTGKVKEAVKKYVRNGDTIACDVAADFTVIAGVSNWGGYAVSCALYLLNTCEIHERYLRKAVGFPKLSEKETWASSLPSVQKEEKLLAILVNHGIRSGVSGNLAMEVDGLPFYNAHSDMIKQLLEVTI
ncbi:D-glutamate cyclase, mitochondrial isoform X1 [Bufo gargarizans]|uniref:D-glutamate cyclase, mitochondrial isoform X1 n=2 Tax=Bufo gargarizans TaxID=30331 RepID=UPI001CF42DF8|nr:D-glutamate cyclase, mitochondrial isoform X1 [Bufo gargarizans]XP_044128481.1 D-glutamate cyclase, mitochondrial isoform X1 [Bufo gargarizans]XP_044128482.1 D-glutamate cyclase, mitochondrial isoform X1 [Bufo gargarizans]